MTKPCEEHTPTPFGHMLQGGGVRCSCLWKSEGSSLKDGWKQFRSHFRDEVQTVAIVGVPDESEQSSIYDFLRS